MAAAGAAAAAMAPGLTAAVTAAATAAAEREEAQEEAKAEAATAAATAEKEAAKAVVATEAVTLAAATAAAREARPSPSRPRRSPSLGHWTCCTRIRSLADELAETSARNGSSAKSAKRRNHRPTRQRVLVRASVAAARCRAVARCSSTSTAARSDATADRPPSERSVRFASTVAMTRYALFSLLLCFNVSSSFHLPTQPQPQPQRHRRPQPSQQPRLQRYASDVRMEEYSTKVKIMAETRAPLRQARIFFLYPSAIAGASVGSYVSLLRAIGGQGEGFSDFGNLAVNLGVIATAIYFLRADLSGRDETLKEVAIELGEKEQEIDPAEVPDLFKEQ